MNLTSPPPISIDKLIIRLTQLPSLPMSSLLVLWNIYFFELPKRRTRARMLIGLAHKIPEVAFAESEMELRVTRKMVKTALTPTNRPRQECDLSLNESYLDISALFKHFLTLYPDLTEQEAVWMTCRLPYGWPSRRNEALVPAELRIRWPDDAGESTPSQS